MSFDAVRSAPYRSTILTSSFLGGKSKASRTCQMYSLFAFAEDVHALLKILSSPPCSGDISSPSFLASTICPNSDSEARHSPAGQRKAEGLDTFYSAAYIFIKWVSHKQHGVIISEVATDWHEPVIPFHTMWPPVIGCANGVAPTLQVAGILWQQSATLGLYTVV